MCWSAGWVLNPRSSFLLINGRWSLKRKTMPEPAGGEVREYAYGLARIQFMGKITAGRVIFAEPATAASSRPPEMVKKGVKERLHRSIKEPQQTIAQPTQNQPCPGAGVDAVDRGLSRRRSAAANDDVVPGGSG